MYAVCGGGKGSSIKEKTLLISGGSARVKYIQRTHITLWPR